MTDTFRKQWRKAGGRECRRPCKPSRSPRWWKKKPASPRERPLVAGVFVNRLRIGMRLECDPTTIYAALLDNRYRGVIHKSDLASQNPYNTYQHTGLPPGPIANPGRRRDRGGAASRRNRLPVFRRQARRRRPQFLLRPSRPQPGDQSLPPGLAPVVFLKNSLQAREPALF